MVVRGFQSLSSLLPVPAVASRFFFSAVVTMSSAVAAPSSAVAKAATTSASHARMPVGVVVCYGVIAVASLLAELRALPVYAHMMLVTVSVIYIGSSNSLKTHGSGADGSSGEGGEQMQTKDALMFPILGSAVLFSLYCVFKFLPPDMVNLALKAYFFVFGVAVLTANFAALLGAAMPADIAQQWSERTWSLHRPKWWPWASEAKQTNSAAITASDDSKAVATASTAPVVVPAAGAAVPHVDDALLTISQLEIGGGVLACCVGVWYVLTNHWLSSNMFGMAFSIQGIDLLSLGSFLNGVILLCGLFVYDVFWVSYAAHTHTIIHLSTLIHALAAALRIGILFV